MPRFLFYTTDGQTILGDLTTDRPQLLGEGEGGNPQEAWENFHDGEGAWIDSLSENGATYYLPEDSVFAIEITSDPVNLSTEYNRDLWEHTGGVPEEGL